MKIPKSSQNGQIKPIQTFERSPCPVIGLADEYRPGFTDPTHSHQRSQLLYASKGVMSVNVPSAQYCIPPQRALWIPAGTPHEVSCRGEVSLRTLYFDASTGLQDLHCHVLETSSFLRALILEVVSFAANDSRSPRETSISDLLIDEIRSMPSAPFRVPMPEDPRLLRPCRAFLANPADNRDLDAWAAFGGMGRRTFTRLFKTTTGFGFGAWRQQARLMEALALLASGYPIAEVAYALGYESPSAFTAMFHRFFGLPPSRYRLSADERSVPAGRSIGP
jgi:AraC-like DNA-binding protein/mannose-6-phosphate isomerase-like protein (cupin superfamily)